MTERIDILIVEDRAMMRAILRDFLQSGFPGFNIAEASSGGRAFELLHERSTTVVLMDSALADSNGIELTAEIKALAPHTQVIVVSQHTGEPYMERAYAAGAYAFVAKENIYAELIPFVARALREASPEAGPGACG